MEYGNKMKADVVLGGGVAGLAAAHLLCQKSSRPVTLLEREAALGGLARTLEWEGCRLDFGPHRIYTVLPGIERFILDVLGRDVLRVKRRSSMLLRGRFLEYPVSFGEVWRCLGLWTALRIGLSYARSLGAFWNHLPAERQSYSEYLTTRFGAYLYRLLFRDYARKVWQEDPAVLSADMARTRLASPHLLASALEAVRPSGKGAVQEFLYPSGGIGRLSARMGEAVCSAGGTVHCEHEIQKIVLSGRRIQSIIGRKPGGAFEIEPEYVISTLPLPVLFNALEPSAPEEVLEAVGDLPFADSILVYVLFDQPQVRQDSWLYFPDPDVLFTRIYEVNNFDRSNVPPGKSCLCAEIPCRRGDKTWALTDAGIIGRVEADLQRIGLGDPSKRVKTRVVRLGNVYPIYRRGYEQSLSKVVAYMSKIQNLVSTGRGGFFCYNNVDHSIDMGLLAAEYLLGIHTDGGGTEAYYRLRSRFQQYRIVD